MPSDPNRAAATPAASSDRPAPAADGDFGEPKSPPGVWSNLLAKHRWLGFVLPLVVYMLAGQLEQQDTPAQPATESAAGVTDDAPDDAPVDAESDPFADDQPDTAAGDGFAGSAGVPPAQPPSAWYPLAYALRIGLTLLAMGLVWPV